MPEGSEDGTAKGARTASIARDPRTWGPWLWDFMAAIALSLPASAGTGCHDPVVAFVRSLPAVLPCSACGLHMAMYIEAHPVAAHDRAAFSSWVLGFRNAVNRRIGHACVDMSYMHRPFQTPPGQEREIATCTGRTLHPQHALVVIAATLGVVFVTAVAVSVCRRMLRTRASVPAQGEQK
jgi:hypothetical protein